MREKKPIHKKWWFWAIVVIIVAGAVNGGRGNEATTTEAAASVEPAPTTAPDPTYKEAKLPEFNITEERLDKSGIWYVTMSTSSKDERELQKLVRNSAILAAAKSQVVESVFVYVDAAGSEATRIATGKMALTSKGEVQTALKKGEVEFKLIEADPSKSD